MKKVLILTMIFVGVLLLVPSYAEKIIICGTGDSQSLLREIATTFEQEHKGIDIEVPDSIGSSGGIRMTAKDKCDLGRTARPLKKKEKKYNLHYIEFAYSPVVFAANLPGVNELKLSSNEILEIYKGQIRNWKSLVGIYAPIYVANREKGDSSRTVLEKNMPGWKENEKFAGATVYSTPELVDILKNNKYTIGYGPLSMLKDSSLVIISVDGISPTEENIKQGKYKFVTPFGIVWKKELKGAKKAFLDYLFSDRARKIMNKYGVVQAKRYNDL